MAGKVLIAVLLAALMMVGTHCGHGQWVVRVNGVQVYPWDRPEPFERRVLGPYELYQGPPWARLQQSPGAWMIPAPGW